MDFFLNMVERFRVRIYNKLTIDRWYRQSCFSFLFFFFSVWGGWKCQRGQSPILIVMSHGKMEQQVIVGSVVLFAGFELAFSE